MDARACTHTHTHAQSQWWQQHLQRAMTLLPRHSVAHPRARVKRKWKGPCTLSCRAPATDQPIAFTKAVSRQHNVRPAAVLSKQPWQKGLNEQQAITPRGQGPGRLAGRSVCGELAWPMVYWVCGQIRDSSLQCCRGGTIPLCWMLWVTNMVKASQRQRRFLMASLLCGVCPVLWVFNDTPGEDSVLSDAGPVSGRKIQ